MSFSISPLSSPFLYTSSQFPNISFSKNREIAILWCHIWATHEINEGKSLQGRIYNLQAFLFELPILGHITYFFISLFGCENLDVLMKQALEAYNLPAAYLLIELGANTEITNQDNETLLDLLAQKGILTKKFSAGDLKMAQNLLAKKMPFYITKEFSYMLDQAIDENYYSLVISLMKENIKPSQSWEKIQQNEIAAQPKSPLQCLGGTIISPSYPIPYEIKTLFSHYIDYLQSMFLKKDRYIPVILSTDSTLKETFIESWMMKIKHENRCVSLKNKKKIVKIDFSCFPLTSLPQLISFLNSSPNTILYCDHFGYFLEKNKRGMHLYKPQLQKFIETKRVIFSMSHPSHIDHLKSFQNLYGCFTYHFYLPDTSHLSQKNTFILLKYLAQKLQKYHHIFISDESLQAVIDYTHYINPNPTFDVFLNILDQAIACLKLKNLSSYSNYQNEIKKQVRLQSQLNYLKRLPLKFTHERASLIERIQNDMVSLPFFSESLEKAQVMKSLQAFSRTPLIQSQKAIDQKTLEQMFSQFIIGQKPAIKALSEALIIYKARMSNCFKQGPFSLLLTGASGAGKTEIAKTIAKIENLSLIRVNMGEYTSPQDASRLIGAAPGLVGHDKGGELTNKIKKNPRSVLLIDEIEKANPICLHFLYHLLEGELSDAQGNNINCNELIVIITSNAGLKTIIDYLKPPTFYEKHIHSSPKKPLEERVEEELRNDSIFPTPLLGRIKRTIPIFPLTPHELQQVAKLELKKARACIEKEYNLSLGWTESAEIRLVQEIMKNNDHFRYGARKLIPSINKHLIRPISNMICQKRLPSPSQILWDYDQNEFQLTIREPQLAITLP